MGRTRNMGNVYGMTSWQFKQMQREFEALPEDSPIKQRIREREAKLVEKINENFEKKALESGFEKVGEGKFEKHYEPMIICPVGGAGCQFFSTQKERDEHLYNEHPNHYEPPREEFADK